MKMEKKNQRQVDKKKEEEKNCSYRESKSLPTFFKVALSLSSDFSLSSIPESLIFNFFWSLYIITRRLHSF